MTRSAVDYFSEELLRHDLKGKTVRGGLYTGLAQGMSALIGLIAVPVMARLLEPADFGLVAMVAVVTGFASLFIDAGLSTATIQRNRITHGQVTNLFWVAVALGCAMAASVALLSPAIAWFYNEPRLLAITLALVISFVFAGLTVQHHALMRRGMQFRALAIVQITSVMLGQGLGIFWAWHYHSYWALVWSAVVTAAARMIGTWIACRWKPGLPQRGTKVRPLIGFGAYLTGFNVVNYFARNLDYMLIGWYWGAVQLGIYERAYRILLFPLQQLNAPMSSVAVPALSRLTENADRYRGFWRRGSAIAAYIQLPLVCIAALSTRELTLTFLGPGWEGSIPVFQALIPAMLLSFTAPSTSWVFTSWGRPDKQLKMALVCSLITLGGFGISLPYGVVAMAWTFSLTQVAIRPFCIAYCFAETPLRWRDLWIAVRGPVAAAAGALVLSIMILLVVPLWDSVLARLITKSIMFAGLYLATMMLTVEGRSFLRQIESWLVHSFFGRGGGEKQPAAPPSVTAPSERNAAFNREE